MLVINVFYLKYGFFSIFFWIRYLLSNFEFSPLSLLMWTIFSFKILPTFEANYGNWIENSVKNKFKLCDLKLFPWLPRGRTNPQWFVRACSAGKLVCRSSHTCLGTLCALVIYVWSHAAPCHVPHTCSQLHYLVGYLLMRAWVEALQTAMCLSTKESEL